MARGGKILLVTDEAGAKAASDGVWQTIVMPDCDPSIAPDQPRNLAKSVTVE